MVCIVGFLLESGLGFSSDTVIDWKTLRIIVTELFPNLEVVSELLLDARSDIGNNYKTLDETSERPCVDHLLMADT